MVWIFLAGIADVGAEATETARQILTLRERHRTVIADRLGCATRKSHRVLEHLFEHPIISIISINEIANLIGITYAAANHLVERLITVGVLSEITGQTRNRRFGYPYIAPFAEEENDLGAPGDRRTEALTEALASCRWPVQTRALPLLTHFRRPGSSWPQRYGG
jgi:predicted transcriptional regulator